MYSIICMKYYGQPHFLCDHMIMYYPIQYDSIIHLYHILYLASLSYKIL